MSKSKNEQVQSLIGVYWVQKKKNSNALPSNRLYLGAFFLCLQSRSLPRNNAWENKCPKHGANSIVRGANKEFVRGWKKPTTSTLSEEGVKPLKKEISEPWYSHCEKQGLITEVLLISDFSRG